MKSSVIQAPIPNAKVRSTTFDGLEEMARVLGKILMKRLRLEILQNTPDLPPEIAGYTEEGYFLAHQPAAGQMSLADANYSFEMELRLIGDPDPSQVNEVDKHDETIADLKALLYRAADCIKREGGETIAKVIADIEKALA